MCPSFSCMLSIEGNLVLISYALTKLYFKNNMQDLFETTNVEDESNPLVIYPQKTIKHKRQEIEKQNYMDDDLDRANLFDETDKKLLMQSLSGWNGTNDHVYWCKTKLNNKNKKFK